MVRKQVWRVLQNPSSLCARVMKAKYFPRTSILDAQLGAKPSLIWRSMHATLSDVKEGVAWRVGDRKTIKVWKDPWLGRNRIISPDRNCRGVDANMTVNALFVEGEKRWCTDKIAWYFQFNECQDVLQVPLSKGESQDILIRSLEKNGEFSVRSAYRDWIAKEELNGDNMGGMVDNHELHSFWTQLWKAKLPPKVKNFAWKMGRNILPVAKNLYNRRVIDNPKCNRCQNHEENIPHALWQCPFAMKVWQTPMLKTAGLGVWENDVKEFLVRLATRLKEEDFDSMLMIMWMIWYERNRSRMGEKGSDPTMVARKALELHDEYQLVNKKKTRRIIKRKEKWTKPEEGMLKMNFDAAWTMESRWSGVGIIGRNAAGQHIYSKAVPILNVKDADTAEASSMGSLPCCQGGSRVGPKFSDI